MGKKERKLTFQKHLKKKLDKFKDKLLEKYKKDINDLFSFQKWIQNNKDINKKV